MKRVSSEKGGVEDGLPGTPLAGWVDGAAAVAREAGGGASQQGAQKRVDPEKTKVLSAAPDARSTDSERWPEGQPLEVNKEANQTLKQSLFPWVAVQTPGRSRRWGKEAENWPA